MKKMLSLRMKVPRLEEEREIDFSRVPTPVCSCTGVPHQCRKWRRGWHSTCCTKNLSEHPLPFIRINSRATGRKRRRMTGRMMCHDAYTKLLQRLAAEGHDLSRAVDLKDHWARNGTNRYKIIK